jgi:glycosyltransferase involved in cell wall biosynthesis
MNQECPLVSVRIVCFNQEKFIEECIDSVLEQDYPNIEIIIADDCSTDRTIDILKEYKHKFPDKIILALSEKNEGITKNINSGLKLCKGKYIAGLGGDDLMLPGKIKKQVEYMEKNPECTICYHNLDVFDSDSNKTLYYFNENNKYEGDARVAIKYGTFNGGCSNMVRADKVPKNGFNETLPVAADWLFWCECLLNGGTINYIDEVLGRYRRHQNNITNNINNNINQSDIDHLNSYNILLAKAPKYIDELNYKNATLFRSFRNFYNRKYYRKLLFMSLKYKITWKSLFLYCISMVKK